MKKAGSRILIITFGIMAAIAILYPWKFVPEYGILQMTESGEKAGKTAESQESDEEYMQVADRAVEVLFTGDTDTLLSLLPERYFGQYGETLQWKRNFRNCKMKLGIYKLPIGQSDQKNSPKATWKK